MYFLEAFKWLFLSLVEHILEMFFSNAWQQLELVHSWCNYATLVEKFYKFCFISFYQYFSYLWQYCLCMVCKISKIKLPSYEPYFVPLPFSYIYLFFWQQRYAFSWDQLKERKK